MIWSILLFLFSVHANANITEEKTKFLADGKPQEAFFIQASDPKKSNWFALIPDLTGYPATGSLVTEMASRFKMVAAINANFYKETKEELFEPIGLVVSRGRIYSFPHQHFPSVGVMNDKLEWGFVSAESSFQMRFLQKDISMKGSICRLNAPATKVCAALWTNSPPSQITRGIAVHGDGHAPRIGTYDLPVVKPNLPTGQRKEVWFLEFATSESLPAGAKNLAVGFSFQLKGDTPSPLNWNSVIEAVSGSHVCVFRNGTLETLPKVDRPWAKSAQPRTIVGVDVKGKPFAAIIDGRRTDSHGTSVEQACRYAHEKLKAPWVVNLDGGGSSVLVYKSKITNTPSNGYARPVAVGWGVR